MRKNKMVRRRPPKTAAITIKGVVEDFNYGEALRTARQEIPLEQIGNLSTKVRKAVNGGMLIEIAGTDRANKADQLALKLREVLKTSAVISRPIKKGELRLIGLDESILSEEISKVIANNGGCTVDEVKVGLIRIMKNGLRMVWVQCPLSAAVKISNPGKIKIGWTIARVELLKARPMQCFRCWEFGHVRYKCTSPIDRTGACFGCGRMGHPVQMCKEEPICVLCKEKGLAYDHRLGGPRCQSREHSDVVPVRRTEDGGMDYD